MSITSTLAALATASAFATWPNFTFTWANSAPSCNAKFCCIASLYGLLVEIALFFHDNMRDFYSYGFGISYITPTYAYIFEYTLKIFSPQILRTVYFEYTEKIFSSKWSVCDRCTDRRRFIRTKKGIFHY